MCYTIGMDETMAFDQSDLFVAHVTTKCPFCGISNSMELANTVSIDGQYWRTCQTCGKDYAYAGSQVERKEWQLRQFMEKRGHA